MHQGLTGEAKKILEDDIHKNGGSPYELSNYGLCLAVSGDLEGSNAQLKAAEFYANLTDNNDAKAIVLFNQAIVNFITDSVHAGIRKLEKAFDLDSTISDYIEYSKIIANLMKKNPDLSNQILALVEKSAHNNANSADVKTRAAYYRR